MGYAVYHAEKGKTSPGGIGNHIDRKEGMEHTYRHADPEMREHNSYWKGNRYTELPLCDGIKERIKDGRQGRGKVRKDAVRYVTHVLTGSHEQLKAIFGDKGRAQGWARANLQWAKDEFGAENIVRFALHMDEKTPHIHLVTVPLTKEGRLSAKEVMGGPKEMAERQDRYAAAMEPFGLERGIKRTGIRHEDAREYYGRIERATKTAEKNILEPSRNILGQYRENSVLEMQNSLKSAHLALIDLRGKYERERAKAKSKELAGERLRKETDAKQRELLEFQKRAMEIIRDPVKSEAARKQLQRREKGHGKDRGKGMGT